MFPQHRNASIPTGSVPPASPPGGDELPACLSCRRRKLRCSREQPSCSQCLRLASECVYDQKRQKPGLKTGAIENINQRIQHLEQKLDDLSRGRAPPQTAALDPADVREYASLLLSSLAAHLGDRANGSIPNAGSRSGDGGLLVHSPTASVEDGRPTKRRRIEPVEAEDELPPENVLDTVITKYFQTVHHWIPMLHERRLRRRLRDGDDSSKMTVLLHAIVATTLKHVLRDHATSSLEPEVVRKYVSRSTKFVTSQAANGLSMEICQALVMLCFERMGSGEWMKAYPLIGLLVRAVDQLGLSVEPDQRRPKPLLPPLTILGDATNAELEERKRVFWISFMLDRLCSVSSGFSTGFTSDNVCRQLPCNGGIWRRGEESRTPYFGIWEKSQARIGNSISLLPTHKAPMVDRSHHATSPSTGAAVDISQLGALAYRLEATESLSQVSSFFLQLNVDFEDRGQVSDWLTRFKELDLRLVQWKKFLPERWKESNVSRDAIVRMDPNLTLAHCLHNTALILLHQQIAYPPPGLKAMCKLPNFCSAETCEQAAVETSAITSKYLRFTEEIMVNTEFVYCAMVAAKALLVHSYYYNSTLSSEFFTLVQNMEEMSRRWRGLGGNPLRQSTPITDLAGIYAQRLRDYHARCQREPEFADKIVTYSGVDVLGALDRDPDALTAALTSAADTPSTNVAGGSGSRVARSEREDITPIHWPRSMSDPSATSSPVNQMVRPPSAQAQVTSTSNQANINAFRPANFGSPDNLMMMSELLNGQGFTDLDRVIYSNGADFGGFYGNDFSYNFTQS